MALLNSTLTDGDDAGVRLVVVVRIVVFPGRVRGPERQVIPAKVLPCLRCSVQRGFESRFQELQNSNTDIGMHNAYTE